MLYTKVTLNPLTPSEGDPTQWIMDDPGAPPILPHEGVQSDTLFLAKGRGSATIDHVCAKGRRQSK